MRRLAVCAFVVLAAGLVLAPGALASTSVKHAPLRVRHAALETRPAAAAGVNFQRLGDTTYAISGHVLDYSGNPVAGAGVVCGGWDISNNYVSGGQPPDTTDNTGVFSFVGVTGGHANGDDLTIFYPASPGLQWMESWKLNFATQNDATLPTPYSYEMQPASLDVNIAGAPAGEPVAEVTVGQMDTGEAWSDMALTAGSGTAAVLPLSFDAVAAGFYDARGAMTAETEWLSPGATPVPVTAGKPATNPVNLDWSQAKHAYLAGPSCRHSGKPGSTVKMILKGWPVNETARIYDSVGATEVSSTGVGNTYTVAARISKKSPVDVQEFDTYRVDNPESFIVLWDYFQVCTFKASASAIHRGGAVRLSGKVPAGAGYVTVYWRHKAAGQPGTLAAKGWVKGGRYRIKSEKFVSGLLHPTRTTWYVAKYKGFDFPAFTSVIKVAVR